MIIHLQHALDADTVDAIREELQPDAFTSGSVSAGRAAKQVKANRQLNNHPLEQQVTDMLLKRMLQHPLVKSVVRPKRVVRTLINAYNSGEQYGWHVDEALMADARTDVSFTLSLSRANDYQGGNLAIEDSTGEREWHLDSGDVLLYPSSYLHRVTAVTHGERVALVGWFESFIRHAQRRELLFELEQSVRSEFDTHGKTENYDRLSRVLQNLLREWSS